jgi:type I restriction enzyme M protein
MMKNELTHIIKKCCDILRTDDGISGAIHYTEALSWLLYLKFLSDRETQLAEQADISGDDYSPLLETKYQWESWAGKSSTISGADLVPFINDELFPYLASLEAHKDCDLRAVVASIFKNSTNRINSGYLLKDVIGEIEKIHFNDNDEFHTMAHIYEGLLKDMGEGGGNSGEFYTPRPLIECMVDLVDPQLGQTVYDPACGTGGFLAEAYSHMKEHAKTEDARRFLDTETFYGIEKTPLPYLLCLMNLTLHGMESPRIEKKNTLEKDINTIEDNDKRDIILANPPFGGKEQKMTQKRFPIESNATEVLFMQHIVKTLCINGRAGVVVPEGVLFQTNSAYKALKELMLKTCNLHTVVSLPSGVFLPYSAVKTSVLFFDKTKRTEDVWFYELPLAEGEKLTKKNGITKAHFDELRALFPLRSKTQNSWLVPVEEVFKKDTNLSASTYNPHKQSEEDLLDPTAYVLEIQEALRQSQSEIDALLAELEPST